jgi:hypothetical protein
MKTEQKSAKTWRSRGHNNTELPSPLTDRERKRLLTMKDTFEEPEFPFSGRCIKDLSSAEFLNEINGLSVP